MERISISEILKRRIVVPEIQRDYVWGSHSDVLEQFIGDLNNKLEKACHSKANIGFMYSYRRGNENYIIDGQQRLTTIILLLHFLSAKNPLLHVSFKKLILSDDTMPSFAYRVRPVTLSFMKMLFKCEETNVDSIKNLKDYKSCYEEDLTVKSCLQTLNWFSINQSKFTNLNYETVLQNVEFWYFNVEETSQGEELYITMNSRGERLTESEHIKPRLFNKLSNALEKQQFGKEWDEWEEFFFRNRKGRDIKSIDIAMGNIIRIVAELNTGKILDKGLSLCHIDTFSLEDISTYMSALLAIHEMSEEKACKTGRSFICGEISRLFGDDKGKPGFADGDFNVLKSLLIEYLRPVQTTFHNLEQVYHLMRNLSVRGILKSSKGLLALLDEMKNSKESFYEFMLSAFESDRYNSIIADEQELCKIKIFISKGVASERQIWEAQETSLWKGDIKPLLDWATDDCGCYSVSEFNRMHNLLKEFFMDENKKEDLVSDDTRRALITFEMHAYPWWKYENQVYFGYTADEWRQIILMNSKEFGLFLNSYANSGLTAENFCRSRIEEFIVEKDWAEFVKFSYLLEYLNTKHASYTKSRGLFLEKWCYAKQISVNDKHLFNILKEKESLMLKKNSNYRVDTDHTGNDNWVLVTDNIIKVGIWYEQEVEMKNGKIKPTQQCYVIRVQKNNCPTPEENKSALLQFANDFEFISPEDNSTLRFEWNKEKDYYMLKVPFPNYNDFRGTALIITKLVEQIINSPASLNNWEG